MSRLWNYKCEWCSLPFQVDRPRSQKLRKATCPCGGPGNYVAPYLPRLREARVSGVPVQEDPGHARNGVVVDNCRNVSFGSLSVNGMETAMLVSGSQNVTVGGGTWHTPVGVEKDDKSTINIFNVDHRVPDGKPE